MNFLARVKLSNYYDLILDNLVHESGTPPITDIEGTTALLLDDGTSWEFIDGEWQQIDIATDKIIINSFYPFLTSICNSIECDFVKAQLSAVYEDVVLSLEENNVVKLSGLSSAPRVKKDDFVVIVNYIKKYTTGDCIDWSNCWSEQVCLASDLYGITLPEEPITVLNSYMTKVVNLTETTLDVDNNGIDIRITGDEEVVGVFFVSFPPDFMTMAINMLGYDIFNRDDKEKRQERLGNYTYTNFEPIQYYGSGTYPANLENKIKYWQKIHL